MTSARLLVLMTTVSAPPAAQRTLRRRLSAAAPTFEGLLARLISYKATGGAEAVAIDAEQALFDQIAGRASLEQWIALWEKVGELFRRTEAINLDRKQAVLIAFTNLQKTLA